MVEGILTKTGEDGQKKEIESTEAYVQQFLTETERYFTQLKQQV